MLLAHNINVYNELAQTLTHTNCCCVVMGTGVGKTFVASEYLDNNNLKALVVSPTNSINKSWEKHTKRVDTITYQKLANIYKTIDFSKYDTVICDEVHHVGGPKWGIPIKYLINNNIIKVIGLTESSVRYTDGGRDVAEEFFNGNVIYGESVSSAIEKQILNPVIYVGAMYNSDGLKKTLRGKIQSRLYAKLNLILNKTPTVAEVLKNNMPEGKRKGIIFASTIEDIHSAIDFVKSVYPNAVFKFVHSKQSETINNQVMDWFNKTDEGYLCSVDMISEGVHVKGVNTLIMLRRTESVNLFNQQLGRCLDANSREPAILFDLVNNKYSIKIVKNNVRIQTNSIFDSGKINITESEQLIVKDYTKDIVDVLKEIKQQLNGKWTSEEEQLILNNYQNGIKYLQTLFPERSLSSIKAKIYDLNLRLSTRELPKTWTYEEIEILKKYYPTEGSSKKMRERLPGRRQAVINKKAAELKLESPYKFLSEKDIQFIKDNYANMSISECAKHLNTSTVTIKNYVKKFKLYKTHDKIWTEEENEIVRKYYPTEGKLVYKRLIGRTPKACINHAKILGCTIKERKTWTEEELDILKKYYFSEGLNIVKRLPNRDLSTIRNKASKLGINSRRGKRNRQIKCVETGIVYDNTNIAAQELNVNPRNIRKCASGKCKTAFGYHWIYLK